MIDLQKEVRRYFADYPKQTPTEWCVENLTFDEEDNHGPFRIAGHEYNREPLDSFANESITDRVIVYGVQLKKTGTLMGAGAWLSAIIQLHLFWVMPNVQLVRSFSRDRLMPLLRKSMGTKDLIPTGSERHRFSTMSQKIGASLIDFAGSNSTASVSSRPCRAVFQDEVDKFDQSGGNKEASTSKLADLRTKDMACPIRVKTSTPSFVDGIIWQELEKTDFRRRFVPCPHCAKHVVLVWSRDFTILPILGCEAFMQWDSEARRSDGTWDLDRVEKSARFVCPHCAGHILDRHKTIMDRNGEWRPTRQSARGYAGWHLPSFYALSPERAVGKLAVQFLQDKASLIGLQGFINNECAEPFQSQDTQGKRTERIVERIEVVDNASYMLTCDTQQRRFWAVKSRWIPGKMSIVDARHCDTIEEIRKMQLEEPHVNDPAVVIDSGFGAQSDQEIYRNCARFGERIKRLGKKDQFVGWLPAKGMPSRKRWKHPKSGLELPYHLSSVDPYWGTVDAGKMEMSLFEFAGDFIKDILDRIRKGQGGFTFEVLQSVSIMTFQIDGKTETFWQHMDSEIKLAKVERTTGKVEEKWRLRSKRLPNHILDCVVEAFAFGGFLNLIEFEPSSK